MTIRDILDGIESMWAAFLRGLDIMRTENILDWPIWVFPLLAIVAFIVGAVLLQWVFTLAGDLLDWWEEYGMAVWRFGFFATVWLITFFALMGVFLLLSEATPSDDAIGIMLMVSAGLPTAIVWVVLWLAKKGRDAGHAQQTDD